MAKGNDVFIPNSNARISDWNIEQRFIRREGKRDSRKPGISCSVMPLFDAPKIS